MIFIVFSYSLNFVLFVKLGTKIDINKTVIVDSVIAHFEHILSQNLDCCNKIWEWFKKQNFSKEVLAFTKSHKHFSLSNLEWISWQNTFWVSELMIARRMREA